jgi:hypothetical protein
MLASAAEAVDFRARIQLAPIGRSQHPPALGRQQGWLTISNRDWSAYSLAVNGDNLFIYRENLGGGGIIIPSGASVTIALGRDTYDLRGGGPERLKVRIRNSRTTTLSLEPFGYVGAAGLTGVVNDGDRVTSGVLFSESHGGPIVVRPPPIIVAPPPPVVIRPPAHRPPAVVRPPAHRPPAHRPPGNNRPGGRRDDGWSLIFNFGKK